MGFYSDSMGYEWDFIVTMGYEWDFMVIQWDNIDPGKPAAEVSQE